MFVLTQRAYLVIHIVADIGFAAKFSHVFAVTISHVVGKPHYGHSGVQNMDRL